MKHNFLLDENILYLAVKGVDKHENPDSTATELIDLIGRHCHIITIDKELLGRYWHHLQKLLTLRSRALEPVDFINQFIKNSAKRIINYSDLPDLPPGAKVPNKDIHVVRAASFFHSLLVTSDEKLWEAINRQPILQLKALSPSEAIAFAKEQ